MEMLSNSNPASNELSTSTQQDIYSTLAQQLGAQTLKKFELNESIQWTDVSQKHLAALKPNAFGLSHVYAPQLSDMERLKQRYIDEQNPWPSNIAITSSQLFKHALTQAFSKEISYASVWGLSQLTPQFSAGTNPKFKNFAYLMCVEIFVIVMAYFFQQTTATLFSLIISNMILCWIYFRTRALLNACFAPAPSLQKFSSENLPAYTVLVPLYREEKIIEDLIGYLKQIDWPKHKLQILLLIEKNDTITYEKILQIKLEPHFEVIIVPHGTPQTKPRALNVGLSFATGEYIVIYDAEDRPDPMQLKKAYKVFASNPQKVGCIQSKLAIDNFSDSWLSAQFAIEYDILFSYILPGLSGLKLPLPLGGTSNHFPTKLLKQIGGWDAWNVTEDADLGLRISRRGLQIQTIQSTTWEEAPAHFKNWLPQRTRWLKGWIQTYLVHMRTPIKMMREVGFMGFLAIQAFVAGGVLAPLLYPIALSVLGVQLYHDTFLLMGENTLNNIALSLEGMVLSLGILTGLLPLWLARKNMKISHYRMLYLVLSAPFYWLLISVAAWRALLQFILKPYLWEKTDHGLALKRVAKHISHTS